jgi:hypothetical protein
MPRETPSSVASDLCPAALEQQRALVRVMMAPGGHWLAGIDAEQIAKAKAIGRDARYLAGWVAGHIAYAQPGDHH